MQNYINSKKEPDEWIGVSKADQEVIGAAKNEIDARKGIPHEQVMSKLRHENLHV
jgi:hypothetical protein